ncbi:sirohydrochlorin chelatase [Paenibacillus sp. 32352]|uniref:sirohydrochlorin chelatase n=1 Tax=Paenibacillus sp. 32352 TaxID=1969111 RepID=UPI0009ABF1F4|nr:CbiX/SirB N-terminal domain-containing protein [Paenibacillus sp. 32352]
MVKHGILVISHGSRSEEWVRLVDEAVLAMHVPANVPVYSSFLEIVEGRLIQDGITALEMQGVTDIVVIPLFVSSGSTHIDEISYALGVKKEPVLPTDMLPFDIKARVHFTSPIDDDPDIAAILYEKLKPLSVDPSQEIVLLVGHGSVEKGFFEPWQDGMRKLAMRIQALGGFDEVDTAMLLPDQIPSKLNKWSECKPHHTVLAAPLFLSEGYFTNEVIPSRMQGYTYKYNGRALLPHPLLTRWMERQAAPFLEW